MREPEHTPVEAAASGSTLPGEVAAALRADQQRRWLQGERVLVESYVAQHPGLREQAEPLLELIYNEIVVREQCGEQPQLEEYLDRFPHLARDIRVQFEVHRAIEAGDKSQTTS